MKLKIITRSGSPVEVETDLVSDFGIKPGAIITRGSFKTLGFAVGVDESTKQLYFSLHSDAGKSSYWQSVTDFNSFSTNDITISDECIPITFFYIYQSLQNSYKGKSYLFFNTLLADIAEKNTNNLIPYYNLFKLMEKPCIDYISLSDAYQKKETSTFKLKILLKNSIKKDDDIYLNIPKNDYFNAGTIFRTRGRDDKYVIIGITDDQQHVYSFGRICSYDPYYPVNKIGFHQLIDVFKEGRVEITGSIPVYIFYFLASLPEHSKGLKVRERFWADINEYEIFCELYKKTTLLSSDAIISLLPAHNLIKQAQIVYFKFLAKKNTSLFDNILHEIKKSELKIFRESLKDFSLKQIEVDDVISDSTEDSTKKHIPLLPQSSEMAFKGLKSIFSQERLEVFFDINDITDMRKAIDLEEKKQLKNLNMENPTNSSQEDCVNKEMSSNAEKPTTSSNPDNKVAKNSLTNIKDLYTFFYRIKDPILPPEKSEPEEVKENNNKLEI